MESENTTSGSRLTTPLAVLIGAAVVAAAVLVGALLVVRAVPDSAAYREGYNMGLGHGKDSDINQVCDGLSVGISINDLEPTPRDLDDYEEGCRDGWDDAR